MTASAPPPLSVEILDRYLAALRTAEAPLASTLRPGLSDDEIDLVLAPLSLTASPELRTLWRWRVTSMDTAAQPDAWDLNPAFSLWPPEQAVKETENYRNHPLGAHRPSVAIAGAKFQSLLVLCDTTQATASPVEHFMVDDPEFAIGAPSLGALFAFWTEQLERGDYTHTSGDWEPDPWPSCLLRS